jgi:exopolysaccharide biosynthesis polyprenyl glycosylphosphotransferase
VTSLRRQLLVYALSLSDLILLSTVLYVSVFTWDVLIPISVLAQRQVQVHTILAITVLVLLWKAAFELLGLYRSKRLSRTLPEITDLAKASATATLLIAVVAVVFRVKTVTPGVLVRFLPIALICLVASRLSMRQLLKAIRRRGRNLRQVLVVGTNARAVEFARTVLDRPEVGYRVVGFADDAWIGPHSEKYNPTALVCSLAGFRLYLRHQIIDEVVVALPLKSFYDREDELIRICHEHGVIVRVLTSLFESTTSATRVDEVGTAPVVTFSSVPLDNLRFALKRMFDLIGSIAMLTFLSPLMLIAILLVKIDSRGPAIFAQERVGLNKRRFRIYKFRTMVANAEKLQAHLESSNEAQGPVFKIERDPRITRVGRVLRKTSIDELPQLLNVLKGNMSLVGPRPLPVRDYTGFSQDWQRRRFSVRPGITCLWQVSGRSSISFDQWMRLDMEYIDHWSLWLDIKILARTIPAVVRGAGAA